MRSVPNNKRFLATGASKQEEKTLTFLFPLVMDETTRRLRVPPQMGYYADKHNIFHLLQNMMSSLVIDQPEDPISYMINLLQRDSVDIPKIIILGPPAVGKHTVAKKLSAELGAVHVSIESLLKDPSAPNTQELSAELVVKMIQQRLDNVDCFNKGWVLEGIPQTRLQALSLQQIGILPEHVVMLEAPDDVLLERSQGKLVDPISGDVYHRTYILPAEDNVTKRLEKGRIRSEKQQAAKLQHYRCEVTGLSSAYEQVLKIINSDQPHTDVYQQVLAFVRTRHRPRTPRVLLLGPPGSGKSHQARLLSQKYKMVDVCCGHLLRSIAAEGSLLSEKITPYLDHETPVPDSLVLQVLEERLSRLDCSCRGWILHGFPSDLQQAKSLRESQHQPNRVFLLDLTDDVCLERITLRATDPVSGESFHALTRPAPTAEVQDRLKTRKEDSTETVTHKLRLHRRNITDMQTIFPGAVCIDANQDPHSVFEALQSRLMTD